MSNIVAFFFFSCYNLFGDVMKEKQNAKRIKVEKYRSEEQIEMLRFIRILIIVIILAVGVYLFTRIFVTKDMNNKKEDTNVTAIPGTIDYNSTLIGNMMSKPENEYYVLIYDFKAIDSVFYSGLTNSYSNNEKALKVYVADLSNELNKQHLSTDKNNLTDNIEEFKVTDATLLKIKNSKIEKSFVTDNDISKELATQRK